MKQVANGQQLINIIQDGNIPDIILLDLDMPLLNGYDTAKWIKKNHPDIKILILTMFESMAAKVQAFNIGVDGFITKSIDICSLEKTLDDLVADNQNDQMNYNNTFSERELEFLKYLCAGKKYIAIAAAMNLSLRSAEHIREELLNKLSINNSAALAVYALKNGIVFP